MNETTPEFDIERKTLSFDGETLIQTSNYANEKTFDWLHPKWNKQIIERISIDFQLKAVVEYFKTEINILQRLLEDKKDK